MGITDSLSECYWRVLKVKAWHKAWPPKTCSVKSKSPPFLFWKKYKWRGTCALQEFIDVASHTVFTSMNLNSFGRTSVVHCFNGRCPGTGEPNMSWFNQYLSLFYSRGGSILTPTQINCICQWYCYLHKCHQSFRTSKSWANS